jgi:CheY-like chemotaxis protein
MTRVNPLLMVVDDNPDICNVLQIILESDGYRVITASDGLDAWEKLQQNERPSLILLDWMMPRMDGESFMKTFRTSPLSNIPVIIMSGQKEATNRGRELQGNVCLVKPVELDELLAAVRRFANTPPAQTFRSR